MHKLILFTSLFIICAACFANTADIYAFNNQKQQQKFNRLTHELRCLVCQNQNLADSHAPLAIDLRNHVYQMVLAGQSEQTIKTYLTHRYGDFVLFKPQLKPSTWVLWFAPFILLVLGFIILLNRFTFFAKHKDNHA